MNYKIGDIKKIKNFTAVLLTLLLMSGCDHNNYENPANVGTESVCGTSEITENSTAEGAVTVPDMLEIPDNLKPVYGTEIKDGTYDITVNSSSSMFSVSECKLTVSRGEMTAVMTMSGKGYLYVFMGKSEDASDENKFISFVENEAGEHTFTIPVAALDMGIECAAFSQKKEQWYDRTLLFNASSLPAEAFESGVISTVESLGLEDGEYTAEAWIEGGSGKAKIQSPARIKIENGQAFAEIIWSSSNYDYMVVNGERCELLNADGGSTFLIPVTEFDRKIPVSANTTAMSTPHEIEYTLYFDSSTIKP